MHTTFRHFFIATLNPDAVGAIIAAMQYRSVHNSPTTFNIGSGEMSSLSALSDEIQSLASAEGDRMELTTKSKRVIDVERSSAARAASLSSNDYLRWSAATSLKEGAAKLLAWHLDRALPQFPPDFSHSEWEVDYSTGANRRSTASIPLDGEEILRRSGISSCSNTDDDPTCLGEVPTSYYPCASECATQSCSPSIFDNVIELTHEATEDCDVVLFTMSLGYDVQEMSLETDFSDGSEQEEWFETTVCTLAFVPSESSLVKEVIKQVPPKSLHERGVSPSSDHTTKAKHLNGYLAHRGWLLILLDDATQELTASEIFLAKLAPARLFHPSVRKVMFVDEIFSHTPFPDDAQFLASATTRGKVAKRTIMGLDEKGRLTKYRIPEEPPRRAVMVVSPMRHIPNKKRHKMPLEEITLSLMKDLGLDPEKDYSEEIHTQQEYFTRARALVNSADLRPLSRHLLEVKDFIRSRWIIHHLKLEEGHQLRCEWYGEHVRWNTHLDQLSFAFVMARRELVRKIVEELPLVPETEEISLLQQAIQENSDASEWHPIMSAEGTMLPIHQSKVNPDVVVNDAESTLYVRIMSDARMLQDRQKWEKSRK